MAIKKGYKENFSTLLDAASNDQLAILETQDKATGKTVIAVCAVTFDGAEYHFIPLAKMFDGNPYDELNPPNPNGGFYGAE
jgi:Family of unknown function (DUF6117)